MLDWGGWRPEIIQDLSKISIRSSGRFVRLGRSTQEHMTIEGYCMPPWDRTSPESWPGKPSSPIRSKLTYQFRLGELPSYEGLGTGSPVVVGEAIQGTIELSQFVSVKWVEYHHNTDGWAAVQTPSCLVSSAAGPA
jgi:hypothetical protein